MMTRSPLRLALAAATIGLAVTACSSGSAGSGGSTSGATASTGSRGTTAGSAGATSGSAPTVPTVPSSIAGRSTGAPDAQVGPATPARAADWPTYHRDATRTGAAVGLGPVTGGVTVTAPLRLDGAVYASPIVADGMTVVVTENDTAYGVARGRIAWSNHVGAPVPASELPCGDIDPSGMTGTPVYDPATSTVVAVALLDHPIRHVAYGLDPTTGRTRWSRTVDVSGEAGVTPAAMQERGALLIDGGHAYIPYGGLAGDCSTYRGSIVDLDLSHPVTGAVAHFTIPTSREAGIWAPAGPAVSPAGGILVADGNGATAGSGTYDHSDSVLRLVDDRMVDSFSPSTWRQDNAQDLDLGSQGPTVVGHWVFIDGKRGTAYVLAGDRLGGIGGQVSQQTVCKSFGGTAVSGTTVFVPCSDGLRAVRINADGTMTTLWHASADITGSPVIGSGRLWSLDPAAGMLYSLDPATGAVRGHWSVGASSRFATPALRQESGRNEVLVGTLSGLAGVSWA